MEEGKGARTQSEGRKDGVTLEGQVEDTQHNQHYVTYQAEFDQKRMPVDPDKPDFTSWIYKYEELGQYKVRGRPAAPPASCSPYLAPWSLHPLDPREPLAP